MSGTGDEAASRAADDGAGAPGADAGDLPEYAERVLGVAELIPAGRVMTYGDVAEWLRDEGQPEGGPAKGGGGPRQVGRVMALYGGAVPWWRVVRADGVLLSGSELRVLAHYREEGTPLRGASTAAEGHIPRLDMRRARWDGRPGEGGSHGDVGPQGDGGLSGDGGWRGDGRPQGDGGPRGEGGAGMDG
ncbi:MGMT family protein [Streptomyces halobius]|uniref:MGMT family protein n=1 Tax=Streptomyces halobius TaxID=2879846 RepID=A0ABY4M6E0_9ACTN|nr:MGMT family protein [Streptomyces halobius]UQA93233.1 MGMT family protein [Streptomyces halobius]